MGEPESEHAHLEHTSMGDIGPVSSAAVDDTGKESPPQHDSLIERQHEQHEDDGVMETHPEATGSTDEIVEGALAAAETTQHPSLDEQHATQDLAAMHIDDGNLDSPVLPAEASSPAYHPATQGSQEHEHISATWPSTAADPASSNDIAQPVSEEAAQHSTPMQGEDHYLSYNGGSAVAEGTLHTAAAPDQMREEPVASGVPESKQAQQPHAEDSQAIPKDQARHPQDETATERENLDQEATSNLADTSAATPEGMRAMQRLSRLVTHHSGAHAAF